MRHIQKFASQLGARISIDGSLIVEKHRRYFLLTPKLKETISKSIGFFYAGIYLGKVKNAVFFPSFNLLAMMAERTEANKIVVDEKSEWLFIVGRDIFRRGVKRIIGSMKKGSYTIVVNHRGECLGFGKILSNTDEEKNGQAVVVENISDIGDFLRRERQRPKYGSRHRHQKA